MRGLATINCCTPLAGTSLSDAEAGEPARLFRVLAVRNRVDREKRGTFAYFRVRPEAMGRLHSLVEPAAPAAVG